LQTKIPIIIEFLNLSRNTHKLLRVYPYTSSETVEAPILATLEQGQNQFLFCTGVYSVQGLERSELGGFHGCPGRLWTDFDDSRSIYSYDSMHDALDGV